MFSIIQGVLILDVPCLILDTEHRLHLLDTLSNFVVDVLVLHPFK